jgi:hypothetical protein
MNWKNLSTQIPEKSDYYLCCVWTPISCSYGSTIDYKVEYYDLDKKKFGNYPIEEYDKENLMRYSKVVSWSEITIPNKEQAFFQMEKEGIICPK